VSETAGKVTGVVDVHGTTGAFVHQQQAQPQPGFGALDQIACPACGKAMGLARRSPDAAHGEAFELQTFCCRGCDREIQRSVDAQGRPPPEHDHGAPDALHAGEPRPAAFDPETNRKLTEAFEAAWLAYRQAANHDPNPVETSSARDVLAQRIIQMAQLGERDETVLVADALAHLHHVRRQAASKA
jgi:hypothetical protein